MKITFNIMSYICITHIYILGFRQGKIPHIDEVPIIQKEFIETETPHNPKEEERQAIIESNLKKYFTEHKPYLNPSLSLSDVALSTGINTSYVSHFISNQLQSNFYSFVNNYRIDHAVNLIKDRKGNITSDLLSMESGFKSRSVFYKAFRERMGCSPQEYIKKNILTPPPAPSSLEPLS